MGNRPANGMKFEKFPDILSSAPSYMQLKWPLFANKSGTLLSESSGEGRKEYPETIQAHVKWENVWEEKGNWFRSIHSNGRFKDAFLEFDEMKWYWNVLSGSLNKPGNYMRSINLECLNPPFPEWNNLAFWQKSRWQYSVSETLLLWLLKQTLGKITYLLFQMKRQILKFLFPLS